MYKVVLQHFEGDSCSAKNYRGETTVDVFGDRRNAEAKCNDLMMEASRAGFEVIDYAYFDREHHEAFAYHTAFTRDRRIFPDAREVIKSAR